MIKLTLKLPIIDRILGDLAVACFMQGQMRVKQLLSKRNDLAAAL
ncbi:MAG: Uncharacterised protein [Oceanospirillaceae bacterium UBA2001]|nr:MAG: Uncharacterised protein [Oceanospirillaceae bacterium UBA2001]